MSRISNQLKDELEAYATSLAEVEGAEALPSITHHGYEREGCISKDEINAVYYILTMILPSYRDAYCYAVSTVTKKSKHIQQLKFTEYINSLSPRHLGMDKEDLSDQECELYSLSPLISNGSYIQRIKDEFTAEATTILSNTGMGKKRIKNISTSLRKELSSY